MIEVSNFGQEGIAIYAIFTFTSLYVTDLKSAGTCRHEQTRTKNFV